MKQSRHCERLVIVPSPFCSDRIVCTFRLSQAGQRAQRMYTGS